MLNCCRWRWCRLMALTLVIFPICTILVRLMPPQTFPSIQSVPNTTSLQTWAEDSTHPQLNLSGCRSAEEPTILLGTALGKVITWGTNMDPILDSKAGNCSMSYAAHCPHKCRFTSDWATYRYSADLVVVPVFYYWQQKMLKNLSESM